MAAPARPEAAADDDWLGFARRAAERARRAVEGFPELRDRARRTGRGRGGDMTLAIDRAAEDAVFAELEALGVGLRAISEERGHVDLAGGGPVRVVIDPIDGSLNAKRQLPLYSISLAVADGETMADVEFAYVAELDGAEEWWARRGEGAFFCGEPLPPLGAGAELEILGVESAHPGLVAAGADALAGTEAHRLRMIGSIALSLCYVASTRFDGMLSLRAARSVDAAAGQLIVREAGGSVAFLDESRDLDGVSLRLKMRSRVAAGATRGLLDEVVTSATAAAPEPPAKA